jgi:hypothetical protein
MSNSQENPSVSRTPDTLFKEVHVLVSKEMDKLVDDGKIVSVLRIRYVS